MIANCFPPRNVSGSKRPFRFAKYLPEHGYNPYIVSASGVLPGWPQVYDTADTVHSRQVRQMSRVLQFIERHCLPYSDSMPWIPHAVSTAEQIIVKTKPVAVISTSPPVASHLAAYELKRRFGLRWIADFRDPLFGNPFRTRRGAWMYDSLVEKFICSGADAIIANTDAAWGQWSARYPDASDKIHLIWNGYDPEETAPAAVLPERSRRVLAHVGNIYGGRVPSILFQSIDRLVRSGRLDPETVAIRLVGQVEPIELIIKDPAFMSIADKVEVDCTGESVPEHEARQAMSEADYLLVLDINSKKTGLQVPAKIFDYIRVGRPVLALTTRNSPTDRILAAAGVRYKSIYPDSVPADIDEAVSSFLLYPNISREPSEWFRSTFDGRYQAAKLAAIIDGVVKRAQKVSRICAA